MPLLAINAQNTSTTDNKTKKAPFFRNYSVGVDLVGPAMLMFSDHGEYQGSVQADIKGKYLPVIELGYGKADKYDVDTKVSYNTKAPFFRIGCDFNILKNKFDDYRLMLGVRYAQTSFNYDTTAPTDSTATTFIKNTDKCTLHWLELCAGVDAKVWGPLHMGWSVRYRRQLGSNEFERAPLYAPGYGDASEVTNIMLLYRIALQF